MDVLLRKQLYLNIYKCEFGKTYLVYLGYIVGGGEPRIDSSKVEVIVNWPKTNNVTNVRSFLGATQHWRNFIVNFSFIDSPLHALISVNKFFQWEGKQQEAFNTLKENISTTPVLALSDLQESFEIETYASGYAMGEILMQHKKPICYHSKTFSKKIINYPTYDKELYALVQRVNKLKHYLMGKETIIHTYHQPLQYL